MSNAQIISEFASRPSLANLGPAIDESLTRKVDNINHQLREIEYLPGQTDRVRLLQNEIAILKDQLSDIRRCTRT